MSVLPSNPLFITFFFHLDLLLLSLPLSRRHISRTDLCKDGSIWTLYTSNASNTRPDIVTKENGRYNGTIPQPFNQSIIHVEVTASIAWLPFSVSGTKDE